MQSEVKCHFVSLTFIIVIHLHLFKDYFIFIFFSSATLSLYVSHFLFFSPFLRPTTISLNFCSLFHPFSFTPLFVFPICHLTPLIPSCQHNGVSLQTPLSLSPFVSLVSLSVFSSSHVVPSSHSLIPFLLTALTMLSSSVLDGYRRRRSGQHFCAGAGCSRERRDSLFGHP